MGKLNPSNPTSFRYTNSRYGFSIVLPARWRKYCTVRISKDDHDIEAAIHFQFKNQGKVYGTIFSILVCRLTRKQWFAEGYDDSPLQYITEGNRRIYAYTTMGELPSAFLNRRKSDYNYRKFKREIQLLKQMVNRDVPRSIRTFRLVPAAWLLPSRPYLSNKVKICGCSSRWSKAN